MFTAEFRKFRENELLISSFVVFARKQDLSATLYAGDGFPGTPTWAAIDEHPHQPRRLAGLFISPCLCFLTPNKCCATHAHTHAVTTHTHTQILHTRTHARMCARVHTHTHIQTHTSMSICDYTRTCSTRIYTLTRTYMHTITHINTYAHTQRLTLGALKPGKDTLDEKVIGEIK